jgi:hypothetical protein
VAEAMILVLLIHSDVLELIADGLHRQTRSDRVLLPMPERIAPSLPDGRRIEAASGI